MPEVKMNLPELPEGYEYTGELRYPEAGEYYTIPEGPTVYLSASARRNKRVFILRKKNRLKRVSGGDAYCGTYYFISVITGADDNASATGHYNAGNYFTSYTEGWDFFMKHLADKLKART